MNSADWKQALQQTLDDYRLTRGERRALGEVLAGLTERELGEVQREAFDLARAAAEGRHADEILTWLEDVVKLLRRSTEKDGAGSPRHDVSFSPDHPCAEHIVGLVRQARSHIDVCVFTITDNRISEALIDAHRRGIQLRVITDNEKQNDAGSDVRELGHAGIEVRIDQSPHHMHHKFAIFDQRRLLTGSYNWTRSAAADNRENFLVTNAAGLVDAYQQQFESLWREFE